MRARLVAPSFLVFISGVLAASACSSTSSNRSNPPCAAGESRQCTSATGCEGTQICKQDSSGFEPCVCFDAAGGTGGSSGGTGGSSGGTSDGSGCNQATCSGYLTYCASSAAVSCTCANCGCEVTACGDDPGCTLIVECGRVHGCTTIPSCAACATVWFAQSPNSRDLWGNYYNCAGAARCPGCG